MTKAEMAARLAALEARERARTAAARTKRLEQRRADRARLARQLRLAPDDLTSITARVRWLREFGWRTSRRTVAKVLHDQGVPVCADEHRPGATVDA